MSRLTRDGTAEPVSRDQILRHARGQGNIIFSVQLTTSRIGNLTGLIRTLLYVMTIHTYIHTINSLALNIIAGVYRPTITGQKKSDRKPFFSDKKFLMRTPMCVCVFFPSILDIKFVGRTSRGHTGGRSHRIFNPPSFCGACLDFCREKDSAIPFPRRP